MAAVAREIKIDHDNIRDLYERLKKAYGSHDVEEVEALANTIVRETAIHGEAEELSIYPAMDKYGLRKEAEEDRHQHLEIKKRMHNVDSLLGAFSSNKNDKAKLDELVQAASTAIEVLLNHAKEEEEKDLPRLQDLIKKGANSDSDKEDNKLIKDFLKARKMAPTRPHPTASQSGGVAQAAMGAASKPLDAAIHTTRRLASLKYEHADDANL